MSFGPSPIPGWSAAWTPRPKLTISEWADAARILPETSAARGARWRTSTVPYLADVMDEMLEPGVRKVALMKAAQAAGTEAVLNIIGYFVAHDPAPMLFVAPTFQDVEKLSKGRLADMIRSTPALRAVVHDRRLPTRDGRSES